jgi:ATP-dependent Clp protease protease subunit
MRRLLNLLNSNHKRGAGFRLSVANDVADVYVYDSIGIWGIEAGPFVKEVRALRTSAMNLRINSPGGDVFDARAMKAALEDFDGTVTAYVDGLSASAASFLMMAADEIVMAEGSFVMIHNAWGLTIGNAEDHRTQAALLDKVDNGIVADYVARTGASEEQVRKWMAAETWFTAEEAVENGFANRIAEKSKASAMLYDLSAYANAPGNLKPDNSKTLDSDAQRERERYEARLRLYERN